MSEILLESLRCGGVRIFWRGVREKGGGRTPLGYGPVYDIHRR